MAFQIAPTTPHLNGLTGNGMESSVWSELLEAMNWNTHTYLQRYRNGHSCKVRAHLALCDRRVDRSSLIRCLERLYPKRAMFLSTVPSSSDAMSSRVEKARRRGWTGDSCIFIIESQAISSDLLSIIEAITAGSITAGKSYDSPIYWCPSNVWLVIEDSPESRARFDSLSWKISWTRTR